MSLLIIIVPIALALLLNWLDPDGAPETDLDPIRRPVPPLRRLVNALPRLRHRSS